MICGGCNGTIRFYHSYYGHVLTSYIHTVNTAAAAAAATAVGDVSNPMRIDDDGQNPILHIKVSPCDPYQIITASLDGTVYLWDLRCCCRNTATTNDDKIDGDDDIQVLPIPTWKRLLLAPITTATKTNQVQQQQQQESATATPSSKTYLVDIEYSPDGRTVACIHKEQQQQHHYANNNNTMTTTTARVIRNNDQRQRQRQNTAATSSHISIWSVSTGLCVQRWKVDDAQDEVCSDIAYVVSSSSDGSDHHRHRPAAV